MAVQVGNKPDAGGKGKSEAKKKTPSLSRTQKIQAAVDAGKPFSYVGKKTEPFQCICGGKGKNAIVLKDKAGKEVLVGNTCLKHTGVVVPKAARKPKETPEDKPAAAAAAVTPTA
ncbi:MAG TPA: hypothetical protein ENH82_19815 [bacterium]|nr:hypothetical protein [bacterium]